MMENKAHCCHNICGVSHLSIEFDTLGDWHWLKCFKEKNAILEVVDFSVAVEYILGGRDAPA